MARGLMRKCTALGVAVTAYAILHPAFGFYLTLGSVFGFGGAARAPRYDEALFRAWRPNPARQARAPVVGLRSSRVSKCEPGAI